MTRPAGKTPSDLVAQLPADLRPGRPMVQFYGHDDELADSVRSYLGEALLAAI